MFLNIKMTEGSPTDGPLPEDWEADGQEEFLIPINSRQMWIGQAGSVNDLLVKIASLDYVLLLPAFIITTCIV